MKDKTYQIESQKSPLGDTGICGFIKAIIFDLDGTLLDSVADIALANNSVLKAHFLPEHPVESYIQFIGNGARRLVQLSLPEGLANDAVKVDHFLEAYKKAYWKNIVVESKLYEGIPELLEFLNKNKIPLAIHTNKPHDQTMLIAERLKLVDYFDFILGQNDQFPKKPDPFGALDIAAKLGIEPANILFVGDSEVDMKTAQTAGMYGLGVSWGYGRQSEMEEAGCTEIVSNAFELKRFVEKRIIK